MKKLVRENPALFLEELRNDLERIYAIDTSNNKRFLIKDLISEEWCQEMLVPYPNNVEIEISDEYAD